MTRLFLLLLTLLLSLSGPAMGAISDFDRASLAAKGAPKWIWGHHKPPAKWFKQMNQRGWTPEQITEAMQKGTTETAPNLVNKGNTATRYTHPETGRYVVVDDITQEIIQVGGDGFTPKN